MCFSTSSFAIWMFFFSSYVEFTDLDELRVEIDEVNVRKENHRNNERYALRRPTFDYIACQSIDTSHLFMVYNWSPVLHHDQRKSMLFLLITFLFCFLLSLLEETSLSGQLRAVEHTANTISLVNNTVSYIALFLSCYSADILLLWILCWPACMYVCMYVWMHVRHIRRANCSHKKIYWRYTFNNAKFKVFVMRSYSRSRSLLALCVRAMANMHTHARDILG